MLSKETAEKWMRVAIEEAQKAADRGDEPFGAVLLNSNGEFICSAGNSENTENNPCMHAETTLIRKACQILNSKDLRGCILIANAECCPMCGSALTLAGIKEFYIGAQMEGFCNPYIRLQDLLDKTTWETHATYGILEDECREMIQKARQKKEASDLSLK